MERSMTDSFEVQRVTTARKHQRCDSCCRPIAPKERYVGFAGKWDGDFYAAKLCLGCESLRKLVWGFDAEHGDSLEDDGLAFNQIFEVAAEFGLICYVSSAPAAAASIARTA